MIHDHNKINCNVEPWKQRLSDIYIYDIYLLESPELFLCKTAFKPQVNAQENILAYNL